MRVGPIQFRTYNAAECSCHLPFCTVDFVPSFTPCRCWSRPAKKTHIRQLQRGFFRAFANLPIDGAAYSPDKPNDAHRQRDAGRTYSHANAPNGDARSLVTTNSLPDARWPEPITPPIHCNRSHSSSETACCCMLRSVNRKTSSAALIAQLPTPIMRLFLLITTRVRPSASSTAMAITV